MDHFVWIKDANRVRIWLGRFFGDIIYVYNDQHNQSRITSTPSTSSVTWDMHIKNFRNEIYLPSKLRIETWHEERGM